MLSIDEAQRIVRERAHPLPPRRLELSDALGCVLAEPILADLDLPPFDKALMDGFAVRSEDCQEPGRVRLAIGEEITAGRTPTRPLATGEAAVIMTGAPLPPGTDAVIMHEKTESLDGSVSFNGPIRKGEARLERGREMRRGQRLFEPGTVLNAAKLGVLAGVGKSEVSVVPRPTVLILPTGDELVPTHVTPGPGQIRETNSTVLAALVRSVGGKAIVHPPARDEPDALRQSLLNAMAECPDVLLVCGGVSAGKRDLVPETLGAVGVSALFHKVRLKPGKPLLFGLASPREGEVTAPLVFGLPGNPVSGIVGFLLFVEPALRALRGQPFAGNGPPLRRVHLASAFRHRGDRPTYHPAREEEGDPERTRPLAWAGSSDLFTVAQASGFLRFPEGDRDYAEDEAVEFLPFPIGPL